MKPVLLLAVTASLLTIVQGQEVVPLEEAQRGARKVTETLGTFSDAPFSLTVDVSKPQAIKAGNAGLLIIPDKKLTAEVLTSVGSEITPIGQLWTLNVSLGKDGQAFANEKLRFLTVSDGDQDLQVQLYYLGAVKNAEGKLDLIIFGKGSEPLLKQTITKSESTPTQLFPIEISGRKEDDNTGILSLQITGSYKTDLVVKRQAE